MKKILSVLLILAITLMMVAILPTVQASAATQQQAVDWAKAQIGKWRDYDGKYGAQCVDLFNFYVQEVFGVRPYDYFAVAYAYQLSSRNVPSGWQKIQNTPDFLPQPGDIAIWNSNHGGTGHVAIIVSATLTSFVSIDQNWVNSSKNGSAAAQVTHNYNNFWGVIRPKFDSPVPSKPNVWTTKSVYNSTENVEIYWTKPDYTTDFYVDIWSGGKRVKDYHWTATSHIEPFAVGKYTLFVAARNSSGYSAKAEVSFEVVSIPAPSKPNIHVSKAVYFEGEMINVSWDKCSNAYWYDVTIVNTTTNQIVYSRNSSNTDSTTTFITTTLNKGSYKVLVTAVNDANGYQVTPSDWKYFEVIPEFFIIKGDINKDGKIDMRDLLDTQKHIAHIKRFSNNEITAADVDNDGKITMRDVLRIQKYIARIIDKF